MLNRYARAFFAKLFAPLAAELLRRGISPDAVTIFGTLGLLVGGLVLYPMGELFWGSALMGAMAFTDMIDGNMARQSGRSSPWGAFLDSSMDRIGDGAIFGGLVLFFAGSGQGANAYLALACLIAGFLTSYVKARAEGLGLRCEGGIAERADRVVVILVTTGLVGLFLPMWVLTAAMSLLAAASAFTVAQRVAMVHAQTRPV
ncbi:MAG TPA: CDP-alcohol phosphatidyltransferase family protein [Ornithinimicrobium sp.]|uniref:phosphatidylinositol phosphate synthase n=1 Tax=Ornithinimicrobium sp. TaxID=1977084 RepID=UPI002B482411|nr:CDP-alcohol phosphatidyltransferase family protein [Ornithinimicrobium sp.]HKJ11797.1 CDP-alcohol phosphatidyltransferase family protein [Ornithinimicrobium sp.]